MHYTVKLLISLIGLFTFSASAQLHPAEGSQLHYRIIGFSFPKVPGTGNYTIEVAAGDYNNDAEFLKNIIFRATTNTNKIVAEVPAFGTAYTWRVQGNKQAQAKPVLHHFYTLKSKNTDTTNFRFTVTVPASKYKDAFLFNDGNRVMYNMKGEAVWFLPDIKGIVDDYSVLRDIKLTPQHTITFLTFNMAYELDYDGNILWRAPNNGMVSGDSTEHYHHELTRLANGHYMVLGQEVLPWEWKYGSGGDSSIAILKKGTQPAPGQQIAKLAQMGTVIEYDKNGKVVWSWKSSAFYKGDKLERLHGPYGFKESHENSFYFDEKNKMLYVSFKNTCQVLKIKYPEGTVIDVYDGLALQTVVGGNSLSLFSEQHACKIMAGGNLCMFNNNMANMYAPPNALILQQPTNPDGKLKKVWEYTHTNSNRLRRDMLTSGGNVIELPDRSIFVSSCTPYANVYIVSRDKKILWDAVLEKWELIQKSWKPFPQYRASFIKSRNELEQLIWKNADN